MATRRLESLTAELEIELAIARQRTQIEAELRKLRTQQFEVREGEPICITHLSDGNDSGRCA